MYYDKEYIDKLKKMYDKHVKMVEGMWLRNLCAAVVSAACCGFAVGCMLGSLFTSL